MARFSYTVKYICGVQKTDQRCSTVRDGIYATEVNIQNFDPEKKTRIEKSIYRLVHNNEVLGREPKLVKADPFDKIILPPRTATMDDCCGIGEKFKFTNGTLNIGFLELISDLELNVMA